MTDPTTSPPPTIAAVYRAVLGCPRCCGIPGCDYVAALSRATYADLLRETDAAPDTRPPGGMLLAHEVVVDDTLDRGVVLMRPA